MYNNKKQHKNRQKNTIFKKNNSPSCGSTHPPTSEFLSGFWILFNLTKPLTQLAV